MGGSIEEYRDKYFEEKFEGVHKVLNSILYQTKKTNGNVTELFHRMNEVEQFQAACPGMTIKEKVKEIEKDTEVVRFFGRHPNWGRALTVTFLASILFNIGMIVFQFVKYFGG